MLKMDETQSNLKLNNFQPISQVLTSVGSNTNDKRNELAKAINVEIDKIFGPEIQRNRSGSDIEIVAPLKHKKRHYWSQEHLFTDKSSPVHQSVFISNPRKKDFHIDEPKSIDERKSSQISILHENQRAEIVASVTDRLYSKLSKNEKIFPKTDSIADKKNTQSLSELKICSNARQRLVELSQKALRNKRRIGIPAYTQTKHQITRMKDQEIETQTDLESIVANNSSCNIIQKDASVATDPVTSRLKEIATGSDYEIFYGFDKYTTMEVKSYTNTLVMTDPINKRDCTSQTPALLLFRKKNKISNLKKYMNKPNSRRLLIENSPSPVININISPICSTESYSSDEDSNDILEKKNYFTLSNKVCKNNNNEVKNYTQLSTNRSHIRKDENLKIELGNPDSINNEEFPEEDSIEIPHVMVDFTRSVSLKDYKDLILGQNKDVYPYNLKLSPHKKANKTFVKFQNVAFNTFATTEGEEKCTVKNDDEIRKIGKSSTVYTTDKRIPNSNCNGVSIGKDEGQGEQYSLVDNYEFETINNTVKEIENKSKILRNSHALDACFKKDDQIKDRKTPKQYLNHLIQIRRETIANNDFNQQYNNSYGKK